MLKNRKVQMLVAIVLIVIALVATISAVNPTVNPKADLSWSSRPDLSAYAPGEKNVAPASYRSPLDKCFDVPIREVAACRDASEAAFPSHPSPLDECFDVSLSELASCRNADQTSTP